MKTAAKKAPVVKATAKTPEGSVKSQAKRWLDAQNCYYHMSVQSGYGRRTLDFLICWNGKFVAAEAKKKSGKAQKFQHKIARDIQKAGGVAFIFDDAATLVMRLEAVF